MGTETKMYVGDVGTVWRIDAVESVSGASILEFHVQKPDSTEVTWTATLSDDNHTLLYTIEAGDYDQAGTYKAHAYVEYSSGAKWTGEVFKFKIYDKWK